jgi:hypothetical protein
MAEVFPFRKERVTSNDVTGRLSEVITHAFGGFPDSEVYEDDTGPKPYITLTLSNGQRFEIEIKELRSPAVPCIEHGCGNAPEPGHPRCASCEANPALPPLTNSTVISLAELISNDAEPERQGTTAVKEPATTESADTCFDCGETPTVAGDPTLCGPVRYCRTCAEVAKNSGDPVAWDT